MNWFAQFQNFVGLGNSKEILDDYTTQQPLTPLPNTTLEATLPTKIVPAFPLQGSADPLASMSPLITNDIEHFTWLEDENIVRDEGAIFGLSDAKAEEKTAVIRSYFSHKTAESEGHIEQLNEKIQELNLFIEQRETRIAELKNKTTILDNQQADGEHQLPRTIVGLLCSVAMCVGNYFLIADTLQPLYPNSPWVAVGLFLAGMFNLFGQISLFHTSSRTVGWRQLLEEIGMPLAAAFFVGVQAWQSQPALRAIALFGFVFFLFLFAGKLFLSMLTVLRNDLKIWLNNSELKSDKNTKTVQWEDTMMVFEKEIDDLRIQKWQLIPDLNRAEAERTRLNARRDMLIKIFESEFNLARQLKERLTDRQLREITKRFGE